MMNIERKMKNMKIKGKLNLYRSFAIAIVLFLGIVSALLSMLIIDNVKNITEVYSPSLYYVQKMDTLTSDYRMKQYGHLVAASPEEMEKYDNDLIAVNEQIEEVSAEFQKLITTNKEQELFDNFDTKWEIYKQQSEEIIALSRNKETEKASKLMIEDVYVTYQDFGASFDELLAFEQEQLDIAQSTVSIIFVIIFVVIIAVVLFSIVVATELGKVVIKLITEPVEQITKASELMYEGDMSAAKLITYESEDELGVVAESLRGTMNNLQNYVDEISAHLREIAKGDLTKDSNEITDFRGDFASIKESFVYILKSFNSTLSDIQESSNQVARSSAAIADSSGLLAEGATDQASAIEELTATIATVAGLADESAKSTQESYENIRASADRAEREKAHMEELTAEMERIMQISKEIENIITAIEDIASQTNLLSLNASIEAARAGEAGRGFAVVADQIGKLASDSAQSAVNTRELIEKTLVEIEKGNEITASTSVAFEKMIEDMRMFAESSQIANENAKNQAVALEQVEEGIEQISTVMQNTASAAEESTTVSETLSQEANNLDQLVKHFILY